MERSLLLLIIALGGIWLLLDDQKGHGYLTKFVKNLIPNTPKDWGTVPGLPPELKPSNPGMFDPNAPTVNRTGGVAYD